MLSGHATGACHVSCTVLGRWNDEDVVVTWRDGILDGSPAVLDAIRPLVTSLVDLRRLAPALLLIGRALDEIGHIRMETVDQAVG